MPTPPLDPKTVVEIDGYLEPNAPAIVQRYDVFRKWKDTIDQYEGGYQNFTNGCHKFGFNVGSGGEVVYREWAPNAKEATLIGDFSECLYFLFSVCWRFLRQLIDDWNRISHPMTKDQFGVWEITVPAKAPGVCAIPHDSKLKVCDLYYSLNI